MFDQCFALHAQLRRRLGGADAAVRQESRIWFFIFASQQEIAWNLDEDDIWSLDNFPEDV